MSDELLPTIKTYSQFPNDLKEHNLKERIRTVQVKIALSVNVNRELILLYWYIGRDILSGQQSQG